MCIMRIFRAMCFDEARQCDIDKPLAWKKRFKWFGSYDFVSSRVLDGKFANSKFKDKYTVLCEYEVNDEDITKFQVCGFRELMLDRRISHTVDIKLINKHVIGEMTNGNCC